MQLVIVHYHLRPGGIRRVIERATPHLVRAFTGGRALDRVVLACGEAGDREWLDGFCRRLAPVPVECVVDWALRYCSEQRRAPGRIAAEIRLVLGGILRGAAERPVVVWAHNLGVGRNPLLGRELARLCLAPGISLVAHHHDWWFENRWSRWPEMRRCGVGSLTAAAAAVFPTVPGIRHVAINEADAGLLRRRLGRAAVGWLPNPSEGVRPGPAGVRAVRRWIRARVEDDGPLWVMPCRLLRRKNIGEALLLTRWLRPEAWLITTGGVSSADEGAYARRLAGEARRRGWRLRLGVLEGRGSGRWTVEDLLAAGEAVLLTSLQEGFGLAYLEAAVAGRPLIARRLPTVAPDLARFGFRFPQSYAELLIDPALFDWDSEAERQRRLFAAWKTGLPRECRAWAGLPPLLEGNGGPRPVPFGRLTLSAQMEVLAQPAERSWDRCVPWNPFLRVWRRRAGRGALQRTPWPTAAGRWLSGPAYGRRFARLVNSGPRGAPSAGSGRLVQADFLRGRLGSEHLYPLLWRPET